MSIEKCDLIFDNPSKVYFAGQTISGRVEINFRQVVKLKGIRISFKGYSLVKWREHEQDDTVTYVGNETYFITKYYLIGGEEASLELNEGNYVYSFQFCLPEQIPSSFESHHGYVRYDAKIKIFSHWKNHKVKSSITVICPMDLNSEPQLLEQVKLVKEKNFCCFCCTTGPLTCVAVLPCTGFVPGQIVPVTIEIDNASNVFVSGLKLTLLQTTTYKSQRPKQKSLVKSFPIITQSTGQIGTNNSNTCTQQLLIPSIPASKLINCSIININYELIVEVLVPGVHLNLAVDIPITIGTVPLQEPRSRGTDIGWNFPPPSYEESQFTVRMKESNETQEDVYHNPLYPVYHFDNEK